MTAARFERRREDLIARLAALVEGDARLVACWLQGSLADGTADPLSDVDAYIAVDDGAFDEVTGQQLTLVQRLGAILVGAGSMVPGLRGGHYLLEGPIKLDLFFEPVSRVAATERPAVRMLLDKAGIGPTLKTDRQPSAAETAARLDALYRVMRQGATWPVRLLLRGQFGTFAMVELMLINDNVMSLMAAQLDPRLLFKSRFTVHRLLRPEQQAELNALTRDLIAALVQRDLAALKEMHLRINDAMVREGRAAFAALGLPYPGTEEGDAAIRAFYEREWPE